MKMVENQELLEEMLESAKYEYPLAEEEFVAEILGTCGQTLG